MKALRITEWGRLDSLSLETVEDPIPGPFEISVRVHATALNRADLLQCLGRYPAPPGAPADIPGLEYAGTVEAVGGQVTRYRVGDRVMGLVGGGAFAERVVVHEREAIAIPPGLSTVDAAAVPEAFMTAYDALVLQGGLRSGETVLIHAVGSGVGSAGVQLGSALCADVLGTSRSSGKLERCFPLGLKHGIICDRTPPRFADEVREWTAHRGADLILDLVGGAYLPESIRALATRGRLLLVGLLAGAHAEFSLNELLARRLTLKGTVLRSRPLEERLALARAFEHHVVPLFAANRLKPVIDDVLSVSHISAAMQRMTDNVSFGKIVLQWEPT